MKNSFYCAYGKRIFDFLFSMIFIILFFPLFILISLAIKLDSKGEVIFKQERIGENKKIFVMYKFQTMYNGAEKDKEKYKHLDYTDGPVFKIKNDPRLTGVGKFLNKRGIDELPQLFNILKGEMSFVGPRPLLIDESKKIKSWRLKRFSIKQGLTSPWVISGMHEMKFDEWMKSDVDYIKNKSFLLDINIILTTLKILFKL